MNQEQRDGFARRLRQLIQVKGLQHKDVAELMGVSGEMVRRYTADPCLGVPSHGRIRTLADALGVSTSWLAYGEGDMIQDERVKARRVPVYSPSTWPESGEPAFHVLTGSQANVALLLEDDAMKMQTPGTMALFGRDSIVLVEEGRSAAPGDMVAATDGRRTVVRIYSPQDATGETFTLLAGAPMFPPIRSADGFRLVGRVAEVRSKQ